MIKFYLSYAERILIAATQSKYANFQGVLLPEVQHDTWCKQLNNKGTCNCKTNIFLETNDFSFEIDIQGKLKKIV